MIRFAQDDQNTNEVRSMVKKVLMGIAVFVLLSVVALGVASAAPNRQQGESAPLNF